MNTLVVITTINASDQETQSFLEYFVGWEFIKLIVFLDDPQHMSYASVQRHSDRVTFIPCNKEHWEKELGRLPKDMPEKQHTNIRAGARQARKIGARWAISIDNDEFIYPLMGLDSYLEGSGLDGIEMIKLRPMEAVYTRKIGFGSVPFQTPYFRVHTPTLPEYFDRVSGLNWWMRFRMKTATSMTRRGFLGHTSGKTIFDVNAQITEFKQHRQFSDGKELTGLESKDFFILHFDALNYDHWHQKWFRRIFGTTKATAISKERGKLTGLTKMALRLRFLGADRLLFAYLYVFSERHIQRLIAQNIVAKIDYRNQDSA